MATVLIKVFACFMGFAVLSIFNINNTFAKDYLVKSEAQDIYKISRAINL